MKSICLVMADYIPQHQVSRAATLSLYETLRSQGVPVELILTGFEDKGGIFHNPKTRIVTGNLSADDMEFMRRGVYPDAVKEKYMQDHEMHNRALQHWRTTIQSQYSKYYTDQRYLPISIIELSANDYTNTELSLPLGLHVSNSGGNKYLEYLVFNNDYSQPDVDMTKVLMPETNTEPLFEIQDLHNDILRLAYDLAEFSRSEARIEDLAELDIVSSNELKGRLNSETVKR